MRFLVCYSWFWSVAYGPMHGAVVLHRVPSCRTRNKQTGVQRDLIAMSSCSFPPPHWLASLQCVAHPQEPERQSELVSILKDHSVLNRFRCHNPHCTNATHCKKHLSVHPSVVTYFRVVQYKWSSPLLILLKQEERTQKKKPQKTPNILRSWPFWHCLLTGYSLVKEELSFLRLTGVKFLTLLSGIFQCPMVRPDARVDAGVCTCEEAGRQLTCGSHVQQLMQFWPPLWKGSMENEHGNAYAAWLLVVFIYCIQLYVTSHTVMAVITVVSVDFVIFSFFILLIVLWGTAITQLLLINSWATKVKYNLEAQNVISKNDFYICLKNLPF